MATPPKTITTREFSELTGIPPAAVGELIRDGKLKASKRGGKWAIPRSEVSAARTKSGPPKARTPIAPKPAQPRAQEPVTPAAAPSPAESPGTAPADFTYTVPEFSAMSYLTEKGVAEWLKIGRLKGVKAESGEWRVLASNLQVPDIRRLLRK